jgi:hypothetical protein
MEKKRSLSHADSASCVHEKTEQNFGLSAKVVPEWFSGFRDFTSDLMVYRLKSREPMNASPPKENGYAIFG